MQHTEAPAQARPDASNDTRLTVKSSMSSLRWAIAILLATGGASAFGQDAKTPQHDMSTMDPKSMSSHDMEAMHGKNASMHTMPATVTAVDAKTGIVDVKAGEMALKVHFPPASVADLKSGDQITLHLGFSKK